MKFKMPPTLVLIFSLIVLLGGLTYIIPAGEFDREVRDGRQVVVPGTYQRVEQQPQGLLAILSSPIKGFMEASEVIAFILIVGGAFGVINATGAVMQGIKVVVKRIEKSKVLGTLTIPLLMTVFSFAGATFGFSEETLAFVLIFIAFATAMGYDIIVGVAIPFVGASAGFAAAMINPFTIGIAQGIAELPLFSGIEFRAICWVLITATAIAYVTNYARKVKANPSISPLYGMKIEYPSLHEANGTGDTEFSASHKAVLVIFLLIIVGLIVGALVFHWYIVEMSALFLGGGILAGFAGRLSLRKIAAEFEMGAKDMLLAGMVVAFSRAILVVTRDGRIIDTILESLSGSIGSSSPLISAYAMLVVQSIIHFMVPSGSGQAALTMPIMAPLSDLLGITRQTAVLIYQFGDGINSVILPTSGVTMGVLGIAKIPFELWLKWVWKPVVWMYLVSFILVTVAVLINYGPH